MKGVFSICTVKYPYFLGTLEKAEREKKKQRDLESKKRRMELIEAQQRSEQRLERQRMQQKQLLEKQQSHEMAIKEMDLEIERERSKTMEKMLEMAKSMNMDFEDLKKFLDDN